MATAVQPSTGTPTPPPNPRTKLAVASLVGAAFVLVGVVVAAYVLPEAWRRIVTPALAPLGSMADVALRLVAQIAAVGGIVWVGIAVAGTNPPRGVRGGVFLAIVALVVSLFITRAVGAALEETGVGLPITLVVLAGLLFGVYQLMVAPAVQGWMYAIEEQGWLSTFSYKKMQGQKLRRYTLLGFLLLGWTGVYTMFNYRTAGFGDWRVHVPFVGEPTSTITLLTDIQYSVPLLVAVLVFWVSWRAVNIPTFSDFLIATEAEMNKVSWPSRKGLYQDTIVVLITTLLLTLFLLVVDLFWGWLLSRQVIGVLPAKDSSRPAAVEQAGPQW